MVNDQQGQSGKNWTEVESSLSAPTVFKSRASSSLSKRLVHLASTVVMALHSPTTSQPQPPSRFYSPPHLAVLSPVLTTLLARRPVLAWLLAVSHQSHRFSSPRSSSWVYSDAPEKNMLLRLCSSCQPQSLGLLR